MNCVLFDSMQPSDRYIQGFFFKTGLASRIQGVASRFQSDFVASRYI